MGLVGAGLQLGSREHRRSICCTHSDHQGEGHGAGDTFVHREVARLFVDDECVIRVSWENSGWDLVSGPSVVGPRCYRASPHSPATML